MREGLFIKKNIDKWRQYQYEKTNDPDEMASQFTELVNDLGYSKTFYPQSKVTSYLNGLASRIYLGIYKNKKEESSRIIRFWKTELPMVLYRHRRALFIALFIFVLFAVIGAVSAAHDGTFISAILGSDYVQMTEENIANGDPFGVYKGEEEWKMFISIAINNIQVAFYVFVLGFLLSLGTGWLLLKNGVMVGVFQYLFFSKGLGWASVLVIWIHGTLEISSIILSGAAGIILGNSILFPGTITRKKSMLTGAKDGMKILVGIAPILLIAAFLEGFVTRHTDMPKAISISILAISFAFVSWYFGLYPWQVARKLKSNPVSPITYESPSVNKI